MIYSDGAGETRSSREVGEVCNIWQRALKGKRSERKGIDQLVIPHFSHFFARHSAAYSLFPHVCSQYFRFCSFYCKHRAVVWKPKPSFLASENRHTDCSTVGR